MKGFKQHQFTEEEKQEMKELFNEIDTNKNGVLERNELQAMLEKFNLEDSFLDLCFFIVDENGDGFISFDEFTKFLGYIENVGEDPFIMYKVVFNKIDRDNSGSISFDEMKIFAKLFHSDDSDEAIDAIFAKFNKTREQSITLDELISSMI